VNHSCEDCRLGTSDFDKISIISMCGMKLKRLWKSKTCFQKNLFTKYWAVSCILKKYGPFEEMKTFFFKPGEMGYRKIRLFHTDFKNVTLILGKSAHKKVFIS
jgi:hypothetical protein